MRFLCLFSLFPLLRVDGIPAIPFAVLPDPLFFFFDVYSHKFDLEKVLKRYYHLLQYFSDLVS